MRRILPVAAVLAVLWPSQASAQIYAWRDAKGTLVLSDKKIDAPTDVYVVDGAHEYRTTRAVESPGAHEKFEGLVRQHAELHSLRPELVRAVIQVESGFNPRARSPKGAMGLMQLMPETAKELGVRDPYDPAENIRGGTKYLRQLLDRYSGDVELALAAYNAGFGAVDRYGRQIPPFRETKDYVKKVGSVAGKESRTLASPKVVVYKTIEIVDGRVIPHYSTQRPAAGSYEVIRR